MLPIDRLHKTVNTPEQWHGSDQIHAKKFTSAL